MRCVCVCVLVVFLAGGLADDVEVTLQSGLMLKMLRDMANQTEANSSLNLPANASSIRENITDTFSCENKTYGYYADVDNDCQLFHVCLPSQTPAGRNVTYKWSFICPNETVFNQEVLVCTRPADSIPCEDSPNYYDLNMEIGKTHNQTRKTVDSKETPNKIQRRKPDRKQVLLEKLMEEIAYENIDDKIPEQNSEEFEQIIPLVDVGEAELNTMIQGSETTGNFAEAFDSSNNFEQIFPVTVDKAVNNIAVSNVYKTDVETVDKTVPNDKATVDKTEIEMTEIKKDVPESALEKENEERLAMERSIGKKYNKGYFRFRADI